MAFIKNLTEQYTVIIIGLFLLIISLAGQFDEFIQISSDFLAYFQEEKVQLISLGSLLIILVIIYICLVNEDKNLEQELARYNLQPYRMSQEQYEIHKREMTKKYANQQIIDKNLEEVKRILGPDYVTSNDVKSDPEDRIIFSDESEKEDN